MFYDWGGVGGWVGGGDCILTTGIFYRWFLFLQALVLAKHSQNDLLLRFYLIQSSH